MIALRLPRFRETGPALVLGLGAILGCTQPIPIGPDTGADVPSLDAPARLDTPGADGAADVLAPLDVPAATDTPVVIPDAPTDAGSMCDMLFGSLTGYQSCGEMGTECAFYVDLSDEMFSNCRDVCASAMADCVTANQTSGPPNACMPTGNTACGSGGSDRICTCRI